MGDFVEFVVIPAVVVTFAFVFLFPPVLLVFFWWVNVCARFGHFLGVL